MPERVEPAQGWPIITGEYYVGDPKNPVAVATCASHLKPFPLEHGAAITGPCKTENIGIERLIANIISNPNIRFLIVTGSEVKGHLTGDAIMNIHKNGVKEHRIVGAKGAIPYIENLEEVHIKRFQDQVVECINLLDVEDEARISDAVKQCVAKDPGAFPEEPMIVEIAVEEEEEEEFAGYRPMAAEIATIRSRMSEIEKEMINIGNQNKYAAGVYAGKIEGIMIGLVLTLALLGLLIGGL